ncbi:hypothetical protein ACCS67_27325 [Rhizobium brockwellii]|uniref:hypothetical protein n=1 Tax=Rhizobium brockwellii TaxID=3019932 RepID=UPI003F9E90C8
MGSNTISTIDIERSVVDVYGICRWMGQTLRPFFVGWNNAGQRKKFLPIRNFFIKAALTAH